MERSPSAEKAAEVQGLDGALDVLFTLKEEFAQWADEAQNPSKKEAPDNVLRHIEAMESEYYKRREVAVAGSL